MENTWLQKVLMSLSKNEWRSLGDFLASPYFNRNEKFILFHQLLTSHYGDFSITDTEKINIYKKVSGSKQFNDASYRNLCSDFLGLVLEFLAYEYMVKDNTNKQQFLARALLEKQLLELAEKTLKKSESEIRRAGHDAIELLRTNIWMNDMHILLNIYKNRNRINASNQVMKSDETYKIATEWMLVKIFNSFLNYLKAINNTGDHPDADRINAYLSLYETIAPFQNPITEIYYLLVKMSLQMDDETYYEAKKLFNRTKKQIQQKSHENILIGLLDYANLKVSVNEEWRRELFELYDFKLKDKVWNAGKGLSYASLFNAFMNAIQLKKYNYAEKIVKQNIEFVHPSIAPSINHLCNAWLFFCNGNFDPAHEQLTKVETENLLIKYEMRTLQCLIYFEKKEWDVLGSYLESFRHFIMYNKLSVDIVVTRQFSNFCKYLSALMKYEFRQNKKEREKLKSQITSDEHVYLKNWLLERLD